MFVAALVAIVSHGGSAQVAGKPAMASSARLALADAPNIILIVVDALRADHVSAYGYERPTTPNLDAWVAEPGAIFGDATALSTWTFPSNATLLTGRSPSSIGIQWSDPSSVIPADEVMLAEYLHDVGYYTAGFVTAYYARGYIGFDQGFDHFSEHIGSDGSRARADEINELAIDWFENTWTPVLSGTQPLFLFLYYFDPHTWYNSPPPYDTLYDPTYTGTLTAEVYRDGQDIVAGNIVPTERDVQHLLALYDGDITYWDFYFDEMMAYLESVGLLENSIIVLTSDHGEMFGEHGQWTHRNSLYEEVLRVPLMIRYSGHISAGLVISHPVQTIDIAPSILDWIGLPIPSHLEGKSLRSLISGNDIPQTRDLFAEMDAITDPDAPGYWLAPRYEIRSVRREGWKYIHHIGLPNADQLYQLQPASLFETENLLPDEPDTAESLFQALVDRFGIPTRYFYLPIITVPNFR